MDYNKLREHLADIEHQQWEEWSKNLASELRNMKAKLDEAMDINSVI